MTQPATTTLPRICIFGAGSIGCYVGGRLQAEGVEVSFIGRPRIAEQLREHGLRLSDWRGADIHLASEALHYHSDPQQAAGAELVIVTVKSAATAEAAAQLARVIGPHTVVLSLQNGLRNAEQLRAALPDNPVLAGMISFNVLNRGQGRFHAGSEGELMAEPHPLLQALQPAFQRADLPLELRADMREVQWAKLLMNLNNPLNALSGLPLKEELSRRDYRRCLALMIDEGLSLLTAAGIRPASILPLPMRWLPTLLRVPDWLFARLAQKLLAIDPLARSSMWEDLEAGRATEINSINGEVLQLAQSLGREAPANRRVIELIRAAETGGRRDWSGAELLAALSP